MKYNMFCDPVKDNEVIKEVVKSVIIRQKINNCLHHSPPNINLFWADNYEKWLICMGLWDTYEMISATI